MGKMYDGIIFDWINKQLSLQRLDLFTNTAGTNITYNDDDGLLCRKSQ